MTNFVFRLVSPASSIRGVSG